MSVIGAPFTDGRRNEPQESALSGRANSVRDGNKSRLLLADGNVTRPIAFNVSTFFLFGPS